MTHYVVEINIKKVDTVLPSVERNPGFGVSPKPKAEEVRTVEDVTRIVQKKRTLGGAIAIAQAMLDVVDQDGSETDGE